MFWFLDRRQDIPAAVCFGFVVHWRFWPIIFVVPIITQFGFFTLRTWRFGLVSGSCCLALGAVAYSLYGFEYIDKGYLYHLRRVDTKHNFSVAFYSARHLDNVFHSSLVTILPKAKLLAIVLVGIQKQPLERVLLRQVLVFVALNDVVTAQYHFWWLQLIPLVCVLDGSLLSALSVWAGSQLHWLFWAYLYEIRQLSVVIGVWGACWIFLFGNLNLLRFV